MTNLYLPSLQLARHSNCVSATGYADDSDGCVDDDKIMVIILMLMASESEDFSFLDVFGFLRHFK